MGRRKENTLRIVLSVVLAVAYLVVLIPIAHSIKGSVPVADDFTMQAGLSAGTVLVGSVVRTANLYMTWSGEWVSMLFETLFNPLIYSSATSALCGIEMLVFFLIFVAITLHLISTFLKIYLELDDWLWRYGLAFLVLVSIILCYGYSEVFYWFVGASYNWAIWLTFLTYIAIIRYYEEPETGRYVAMVVFGILSCSYLNCCVPIGLVYLVVAMRNRDINLGERALPLILYIVSGCATAFAPGNFTRQTGNGDYLSVSSAVVNTAKVFACQLRDIITNNTVIVLILLLVFVAGYICGECNEIKCPKLKDIGLGVFTTIIGVYGCLFPTILGYADAFIENRTIFMFNCFLLPMSAAVLFCAGVYVVDKGININRTLIIAIAAFAVLICGIYSLKSGAVYRYTWTRCIIERTAIQKDHDTIIGMYQEIADSNEDNVVVDRSDWTPTGILKDINMYSDTDWWVNQKVAEYYGKDTVSVIWNWE